MPKIPSTPSVLVVTPALTDGFMRDDLRILHQFVDAGVLELSRTPAPGGRVLGRLTRSILNFAWLAYRILRYDMRVVIFWFATRNYAPFMAVLARLLGARVVVITGGKDATYVPDIDWGDMKSGWHRRTFGLLIRLSDAVLPFSDSARDEILRRYAPKRIRTAYPAVDTKHFVPGRERTGGRVVTCCYEYSRTTIVQKGLDQFVAAARRMPDVTFALVGTPVDDSAREFAAAVPPNVELVPRIAGRGRYRDFLASADVYCQLSAHEGFGVAVAEAMACGCIPVVSDRYSLPEVVGDAGHVVAFGDTGAAVAAIAEALRAPEERRVAARRRVEELFGRGNRAAQLREELTRLIPELVDPPLRIELGCGSTGVAGAIGVDGRRTVQTSAVCDVRYACFRTGIADEVYSFCVLEHLDDPYQLMDEVVRILKPDGRAYLRVPNIGTFSSHLDTTHRFLADLKIWRGIMEGYFEHVTVVPEGTKYRDNPLLRFINWALVRGLRFHELTQGWTFVCARRRAVPTRGYTGWWQEPATEES